MGKNSFFKSTIFLAVVACFLWSTAFVGIKIGLRYTTPLQFAGIRFFLSGLLILPFIKDFQQKWQIVKKHWKIIVLVGLLQTTIVYGLFYAGLDKVPAALGAMLIGSGPLFAALMAHIMTSDDKLTRRKTAIILLGMLGVAIISLNKDNASSDYSLLWVGIALLLIHNIIGGIGNVVVSKYGEGLPPMVLSSLSLSFGGAVLFMTSLIFEDFAWKAYPVEYYLSLAWLSFLSAAAITIWFTLLRRPGVKVSNLNTLKFIVPVLGAILSWLLLPDESPNFLAIIGMAIIATALFLLNSRLAKSDTKCV